MPFKVIPGGPDDDYILGTMHNDQISAGDGADVVVAEAGNDKVFGEGGNDTLWGSYGADSLFGGDGDDVLTGAEYLNGFVDHLSGGAGNDTLFTGETENYCNGDEGDDEVVIYFDLGGGARGGSGIDLLTMHYIGSSLASTGLNTDVSVVLQGPAAGATAGGQSMALGGFEQLWITTYMGDDTIQGGAMADHIDVYSGANTVLAKGGDDVVAVRSDDINHLDGGQGLDTLRFVQEAPVAMSLVIHGTDGTDGFGSVLTGFEHWWVMGNALDDFAQLGGRQDHFRGFGGNDTCYGMGGNDWIGGREGDDMLFGGGGNDHLLGGAGIDTLSGGDGADQFQFGNPERGGALVTDMESGVDRVLIQSGALGDMLAAGVVDAGHFSLDTAQGSAPQFVFRATAEVGLSELVWDSNGDAAGAELVIALFGNGAVLTASDLVILA